jgi:hypothetical protein
MKSAKFNNWDAIFPNNDTALDNVQLNDHIREQISQEFHLKIKPDSSDKILLKKVYNAYFKTDVIKTRHDEGKKHYHYYIPDEIRDMFKFGLEKLRPLPMNNDTYDDIFFEEESTDETSCSRVTVILDK